MMGRLLELAGGAAPAEVPQHRILALQLPFPFLHARSSMLKPCFLAASTASCSAVQVRPRPAHRVCSWAFWRTCAAPAGISELFKLTTAGKRVLVLTEGSWAQTVSNWRAPGCGNPLQGHSCALSGRIAVIPSVI